MTLDDLIKELSAIQKADKANGKLEVVITDFNVDSSVLSVKVHENAKDKRSIILEMDYGDLDHDDED